MSSVLVLAVAFLLVYLVVKHHFEFKNYPPGPYRLPIIGSLLATRGTFGSRLLLQSTALAPKYGKLIGYSMGVVRAVFIQDFDLAREVAFDERFNNRLDHSYLNSLRGYDGRKVGVATTEGDGWRRHRRFALSTLKEFGFGKKSMGAVISEEADALAESLAAASGKDLVIDQNFNIYVFNILWRIVAGTRYDPEDPKMVELQKLLAEVFKHAFKDMPFPLVSRVFPSLVGLPEKKRHTAQLKRMFETIIDEKMGEFNPQEKPTDFIQVYIGEMKKGGGNGFNYHDLVGLCMDFFEAGGETVGSTLSWMVMYMALHPDEQRRCQAEIDRVLGAGGAGNAARRAVALEDRERMPRCEAAVMEIQRLSCVAPGGVGFQLREQTQLDGYTLPEGTLLYYNIHKFHTDPAHWSSPEVFDPSRFLTPPADGQTPRIRKDDHFVPFGFGRRVCMGESLARAELFIFTVTILQRFEIGLPKFTKKMPSVDEDVCGFTRSPEPFSIHLRLRGSN